MDYYFDAHTAHDQIIAWIRDWFKDKLGPAVLGVSGGKDSTICAALLAEALGQERVIGVQMPNIKQSDISYSDKVFEVTKIKKLTINIGTAYTALSEEITKSTGLSSEESINLPLYKTNTPARLRMTTLYGIAAIYGGYVVNSCNLSEDFVGYSTKGGDCAGDFSILNKLTVEEVIAIGDFMKLPEELVHKAPSDGLCGKTDEDNLGFTYAELGDTIRRGIKGDNFDKIMKMHKNPNTAFKLFPMPTVEFKLPLKLTEYFH